MAAPSAPPVGGGAPKRRRQGEPRRLLINSARHLFARQGYNGTSTRAIAAHAGVSETLVYRYFRTKANLFEEAVLQPVAHYIAEAVDDWEHRPRLQRSLEEEYRDFLGGLYDLLSENRELVMALVAADAYDLDVRYTDGPGETPLSSVLTRLEHIAETETVGRSLPALKDVMLTVRLTFGMVFAAAVLDHWMFPSGDGKPSRERVVEEMVTYCVHGLAHRPPS